MADADWISFFRETYLSGFVISVNQSVSSGRVVPKHHTCHELRYEFRPTQLADNGMPNKETQAIFYEIEDNLGELIAIDEADIVATRTGQKMRSVWICGSNNLAAGIQEAIAAIKSIAVMLQPSSLADIRALHPTELEGHLARDEDVIANLAGHGDNHSVPRKIDHLIYYDVTAANRKEIEARLKHLGFQLESVRPDAILFFRVSPIELDAIHRDTRALLKLCGELDCEYDGWGTEVMRSTD